MMAAIDHDDAEPPDAIAALEATVDRYKRANAKLAARVAELEGDAGLQPLKGLLASDSEYERARRGWKSGLLQGVRRGGRLFSSPKAVAEWRRITAR